jgi:transposase-like protein
MSITPIIRYSEAFKIQVVREMEAEGLSCSAAGRKYGIGGRNTVEKWARKYGKGLIGKVIRVETPQEVNELKKAKERIKRLESLLADTNLELALERQYMRLACARAGIEDVEEFKKKSDGKPPTAR